MDIEIQIDRERCIGSGQCVHWAPGVFDQDHDAIAVVVDPRGEPAEKIVKTVSNCPMHAITLRVGSARVGPNDFADWVNGASCTDPLVAQLEKLVDQHHELHVALAASPTDAREHVAKVEALTRAHLDREAQAYAAIGALVDLGITEAFSTGHERIDQGLEELKGGARPAAATGRSVSDFARLVNDHIHAEETVLFPIVLAALVRRSTPA